MRPTLILILSILVLLGDGGKLQAAPKHLFKIASLAPAGSVWIEQFEQFGREVSEKTGGSVGFRIYPGGVMGDDQAMYRKMRVGQLHGGGFTMSGISNVVPDFRVLSIPFLFESYQEVDHVIAGILPSLKDAFRRKGLECIAMTEVGFIYAQSTRPIGTLEELRGSKTWSPSGDPVSEAYLSTLDISPIQLTIPDVLSSLQSGLVETVYNSLYGSIVLQWFTKAQYIADIPYGYAYGVFALDSRKFDRLSPTEKEAVREAAEDHFPVLLEKTRESNLRSRQVLADKGTTFMKIDENTRQVLEEKSGQAVDLLVPQSLSRAIYDQVIELRGRYREKAALEQKP